jgi:Mn-containing catalase
MGMGYAALALGKGELLIMWSYEKRLQYPVNITTPNAKIAQIVISQYGGPYR